MSSEQDRELLELAARSDFRGQASKTAAIANGVPEDIALALCDFMAIVAENAMDDGAETLSEVVASGMSPDDYYDFLEGYGIGHRKLRKWVSEKRVGECVRLTKSGKDVAMCITRAAAALAKGEGKV